MRHGKWLSMAVFLVGLAGCGLGQEPPLAFEPIGLGGGGSMYSPAASPHDPNLMFVSCDMGGFYRSQNGGKTWRMIDKRQMRDSMSLSPVFHPTDPGIVYAWGNGALRVSRDGGMTWQPLATDPPWQQSPLTQLALCLDDPGLMLAGGDTGLYVSKDGGFTWTKAESVGGAVSGLYVFPDGGVCFAGTSEGVFRSHDRGATWAACGKGLPAAQVRGLCGAHGAATGETMLYCTVPSRNEGGRYVGGIYRSADLGESWQSAMTETINTDIQRRDEYDVDEVAQYNFIDTDETRPRTVWVTTRGTGYWPPHHWTVFRSDDAGTTWRYTFTGDPRFENRNVQCGWIAYELNWGFGGPPSGFSVCAGNADVAMYTNSGELFITADGGKSWRNGFSYTADGAEEGRGKSWVSTGLNVTSCWDVVFDPFRPDTIYLPYTDIGFARSEDRGRSWAYAAGSSPWRNTFYRVVCDPARAGILYAACSNQHDIPHWTNIDSPRHEGGVCLSEDFGKTWRPLTEGLPKLPCTSLVLDPKSPSEARTLYVAVFGDGVYRSTDGGRTWNRASEGLGAETNRHVYSVRLHPDGTLFCSITGRRTGRDFATPSGLYRSRDGALSWEPLSESLDLRWAGDFAFDPRDSNIIYLAAASAPGYSQGGLYNTTDGGVTWRKLIGDDLEEARRLPMDLSSYTHAFFVTVDEQNPERVYLGATTHGLFLSEDGGETWREVLGIPFTACQRVTIDPQDRGIIWVSTFGGGVWKGPAEGTGG